MSAAPPPTPISPLPGSESAPGATAASLPINTAPGPAIELDSSPITPADSAEAETSREEGESRAVRVEEIAKVQAEKSKDPAVLVNIPKGPAAQDYEVVAHHPEKGEGETDKEADAVEETT